MARQAREELAREVEEAVRRHVAAATLADHQTGSRAGLTLSTCEANFVGLLLMHGDLSPGKLGQLAGLGSSGTITGVIDRLEQAGYVQRKRCVTDRRKVVVALDRERLERDAAARSERLAEILHDYDDDQLDTIAGFLTRLADAETVATAEAAAG